MKKLKKRLAICIAAMMMFQNVNLVMGREYLEESINTPRSVTYSTASGIQLSGTNDLILNGGFEQTESTTESIWKNGLKPQNWTGKGWSGYKLPKCDVEKVDNNGILSIAVTETGSRGVITSSKITVKPETNYQLQALVKLDNVTGNNFRIWIREYDKDNKKGQEKFVDKQGTMDWGILTTEIYTSKTAKYLEVELVAGATNALNTGTIKVDTVQVKPIEVPVTGVKIIKDTKITEEIYDKIGSVHQLDAQVEPANASNKKVTWVSENPDIATVDETGKATFLAKGNTKIKAITEEGNKEAICAISVVETLIIDKIELEPYKEVEKGNQVKLIPQITPVGIVPKKLIWKSSDTTIATVDDTGMVTGQELGEVSITVNVPAENGTALASTQVKVTKEIQNLIPNGGFEIGDAINPTIPEGFKYWTPTGEAQLGIKTDEFYRGQNVFKIQAEKPARTSIATKNNISITPGTYRLSVQVKAKDIVLSNGIRMRYTLIKEDGSRVASYSTGKKISTEGWEEEFAVFEVPEDVTQIGIEVFFETGIGTAWLDELVLQEWVKLENIKLPEKETIDLGGIRTKKLEPIFTPTEASSKGLSWITSNEKIVAVDQEGNITAKKPGKAVITAMSLDKSIKSSCEVTVTGELSPDEIIPVKKVELEPISLSLKENKTVKVKASIIPEEATYQELVWTSSDDSIATVQNGRVTGHHKGKAILTATAHNKVSATCEITVGETQEDELDSIRKTWKNKFNNGQTIQDSAKQTQELWDTMYKNEERNYLWEDIVDYTKGGNITTTARRLRTMAIATTMEGSPFYKNEEMIKDIVEATIWLQENTYSLDHIKYYDWFSWDIGIPQALNDIFSLLLEYFTDEEINQVMGFVGNEIMPDPRYSRAVLKLEKGQPATGANLLDQTKSALMPAILFKDIAKIELCKNSALSTLEYVTKGDGFYTDGSFIQHTCVPYTGSYGVVWLTGMADITELLGNTSYALETNALCKIIKDGFVDFIYEGAIMDMVRGRAIAKENNSDHTGGHEVIKAIVRIAEVIPEPNKSEFLSLCKYWILEDNCESKIQNNYKELLENSSITAQKPDPKSKEYYNMDRTVHHAQNFGYGISKSSKRIQTYELTNGENQKGWYTGDGMTYLYNQDSMQYDDMFWVTVDYNRLPGTTVDTKTRTSGDYQVGDGEKASTNVWAGGTTLEGKYGASGMNLQAVYSDLTGNKSWFMFDNEVVALGSNISSEQGRMIETIIEQRKIDGNNTLLINGEIQAKDLGWTTTAQNVQWIYLEGNQPETQIGYYFPNLETLQLKREARTGTYAAINQTTNLTEYTKNYMTIWKEHGENPQAAEYAYVLLPGQEVEEVRTYTEKPEVEILVQEPEIHAVKESTNKILAANFFGQEGGKADCLTAYQETSVMLKEDNGYLQVSLSDPTLTHESEMIVELEKEVISVLEKSENVQVEILEKSVKIKVDVSESDKGKTFNIKLSTKPTI